ncbi:4Fe-4S dicluster protein [Natranaerovirga pectinivora]|uniref:4Fe-4S dicluster protein n=1 Tax=Natranaerovirga pectinivora TaxID=682400 RepID=A0A4R3MNH5_9FIRM|nr:4Fe-4S binding protein [Natranaerovirga pectinivora]TCT16815.1 4Fe-4S dicluster protein [Natranaerovirga pectinivora]
MFAKVIQIDEDKCIGCGLCANACHQSAIQVIDGKAKLVNESHCDGLGMCLPQCPTDALQLVDREIEEKEPKKMKKEMGHGGGCPGTRSSVINREKAVEIKEDKVEEVKELVSQLNQWPVQIHLISPNAPYLEDADLLIAADCTAYAYANIHNEFIKGRITLIGCPKLDDNDAYKEKFKNILKSNNIRSITVLRMEVPCCGGIVSSVKGAMLESETIVQYNEVIIGVDGSKR